MTIHISYHIYFLLSGRHTNDFTERGVKIKTNRLYIHAIYLKTLNNLLLLHLSRWFNDLHAIAILTIQGSNLDQV